MFLHTATALEIGKLERPVVTSYQVALIVFSLVQRHIVAGLTFGAVKG